MEVEQTQNNQADLSQPNLSEGQPLDVTPANPIKDERIASRMEVLIRRERAALDAEQRAKQREADIQEKLKRIEEFEGVKSKPLDALKLLGLDYNELSQTVLNEGNIPAEVHVKRLEEKIESLTKSLEEKERKTAEQQKAYAEKQAQNAVDNFKKQINSYLDENSAKYELIKFEDAYSKVYDLIDAHYEETKDPDTGVGKIMSIEEAADKLEKQLEEKYSKAKGITKFQSMFESSVPKGVAGQLIKQAREQDQGRVAPRTLTNNQTTAPMKTLNRPLTDDERVQRAIATARAKGLVR